MNLYFKSELKKSKVDNLFYYPHVHHSTVMYIVQLKHPTKINLTIFHQIHRPTGT